MADFRFECPNKKHCIQYGQDIIFDSCKSELKGQEPYCYKWTEEGRKQYRLDIQEVHNIHEWFLGG